MHNAPLLLTERETTKLITKMGEIIGKKMVISRSRTDRTNLYKGSHGVVLSPVHKFHYFASSSKLQRHSCKCTFSHRPLHTDLMGQKTNVTSTFTRWLSLHFYQFKSLGAACCEEISILPWHVYHHQQMKEQGPGQAPGECLFDKHPAKVKIMLASHFFYLVMRQLLPSLGSARECWSQPENIPQRQWPRLVKFLSNDIQRYNKIAD